VVEIDGRNFEVFGQIVAHPELGLLGTGTLQALGDIEDPKSEIALNFRLREGQSSVLLDLFSQHAMLTGITLSFYAQEGQLMAFVGYTVLGSATYSSLQKLGPVEPNQNISVKTQVEVLTDAAPRILLTYLGAEGKSSEQQINFKAEAKPFVMQSKNWNVHLKNASLASAKRQ
jgi:hypothetical protein